MRLSCAVQLVTVILVAHFQATLGLFWLHPGQLNAGRQINPAPSDLVDNPGTSGTVSHSSPIYETFSTTPVGSPTVTTTRSRTSTSRTPISMATTTRTQSTTRTTRPPSNDFDPVDGVGGTTSSRPRTTRPQTSTRTTTKPTTTRSTSTTTHRPPSVTGDGNETESDPPASTPTTSSQEESVSQSIQSDSSIVETSASTTDSSFLPPPASSASETTTSEGRLPASQTSDPTPLADQAGNRSILKNSTASALIFTFTALLVVAIIGLLLYCCYWRRRRQHILLSDSDSDHRVGILRANSTGSRSSGRHRPMSAVSALSDGHYLPARFAGVPPINRQHGFDTAHIENDPFSVHRIIYPDPPGPHSDGHGSRRSYALYPDPVPPAVPLRIAPPRPARPLDAIMSAAGLSAAGVAVTTAEPRSPPRSPTRVKVPTLPQSLSGSSLGHGNDSDPQESARAQSPDSHYDDDGVYHAPPPRTFLIDRRPDTSKRRSN